MKPIVTFSKFESDKQIAYGEVYIPDAIDTDGEFMTAEGIEKMAHNFIKDGFVNKIDTQHDLEENGAVVVESFIVREGDPDFVTKGAWVLGVHIPDDVWPAVKSGELGGFSMYGVAGRQEHEVEIQIPDDGIIKGDTFESSTDDMEPHEHKYVLEIDDTGMVVGGRTDVVLDHYHDIEKGTVTKKAAGHKHRYSFAEALYEDSQDKST